jgi:hypothetical protein
MTHDEAVARCKELQEQEPGRVFAVREGEGGAWDVVRVTLPMEPRSRRLQAETRAGPDVHPDPTEGRHPPLHGQRGF